MYSPGVSFTSNILFLGRTSVNAILYLVSLTAYSFQVLLSLFGTDNHNLYKTPFSYLGKVLYHLKLCVLYLQCS